MSKQAFSSERIEQAVKYTYIQAMLGAVYGASTGGMFLIGYALSLGATDIDIGRMSTIPMLCIGVQLLAAMLVERGISRRWLTIIPALLNVLSWGFIILIPYLGPVLPGGMKIWALIGVITLVTLFAYVSGNARGSWVGDLIPEHFRGTFFGRLGMYASIVAAIFALLEGAFLDVIKNMGVGAFSLLFAFGMLFGLANVALFVPQADVPLAHNKNVGFLRMVRDTFANRALMMVMLYALFWSLQSIAGPFYNTYMLRDLGMPFFGVGLTGVATTITMVLSSPFWGRIVDRYGCRPVLIASTAFFLPLPLIWLGLTSATLVYTVVIPLNLIGGFFIAGISVALNTLIYKVTPSAGRAVQFAIYSILVTLAAAPMPMLGGYLPELVRRLGFHTDLRITFYAAIPCLLAALLAAHRIHEPGAHDARLLIRHLPGHLRRRGVVHEAVVEQE